MAFQNDMANVQKVIYSEDKINLGTTIVHDEDHTLGNIVRMQLLRDNLTLWTSDMQAGGERAGFPGVADDIDVNHSPNIYR